MKKTELNHKPNGSKTQMDRDFKWIKTSNSTTPEWIKNLKNFLSANQAGIISGTVNWFASFVSNTLCKL